MYLIFKSIPIRLKHSKHILKVCVFKVLMDMFYQDEAPYLEDEGKRREERESVNEYFSNLTFQHYYLDYVIKWPLPPSLP